MKITGAIFDLDGTILDSMEMWSKAADLFLESLGIKANSNLQDALSELTLDEGYLFLQKEYKLELSCEQIGEGIINVLKDTYTNKIKPKENVHQLLSFLNKNHIPCVILTSSDRNMFTDCLKNNTLEGFFEDILTCSELKMSKSKPDIYKYAADFLNSKPENTLVFEDAPFAIKTAHNAGFYTIGIYDSFSHSDSDIIDARKNCNYFSMNFNEALQHIKQIMAEE